MIFGMPTLIEQNDLEETLQLAKELGLSFVELNMNLPQYQIEQLGDLDHLNELKNKYQLFYTVHLDENLNVSDFNHLVANAYMETVKRTIGVAKKLGMPVINMHMNHGIYITLPDKKVALFGQYKDRYLESIFEFRRMCEEEIGDADIKICVENTDGFRDYEKEAVEMLLQSDKFALTWDIGHSNASNNVDEGFIMKHFGELKHFHIHDGSGKSNHMTLGTGEIDLNQRLDLAKQGGCRCVVETKTIQALRESVRWLKERGYMV